MEPGDRDEAREHGRPGERPVTYCLVPPELAPELHDLLRRHFRDRPDVEVIVDRRFRERRLRAERRSGGEGRRPGEREAAGSARGVPADDHADRRRIRNLGGRRIGERRAAAVPVEAPADLPRRARRHLDRLSFVERLEPGDQYAEDLDTGRLVTRIQAGEADAFSELYVRYFDRVYGYLRVMVRDPHEAEDLTQQVFIDLIRALQTYERRSQPFRAWLFTVVRNRARMHLRSQRRVEVIDPEELERERESAVESAGELRALGWIVDRDLLLFVERLPAAQRQVLTMRYLLDLPNEEIARILDTTAEAVRALQYRATRTLQSRLASVGRGPARRGREPMRAGVRQAPVLRHRRFALLA